jgi:hypothetical protein
MLSSGAYDQRRRAILSYAIRRLERHDDRPLVSTHFAKAVVESNQLPRVEEQLENLVLYLGRALPEPGAVVNLPASEMRATLGCVTADAVGWILRQVHDSGLVQGIARNNASCPFELVEATLSVEGWNQLRQLTDRGTRSKRAFMAMRFGDAQLDDAFVGHFKPACKRAGFDLVRLDEEPKAGLIDDHLRVEIRRSRFLVADLSHANPGAYWEAGYAEGLGRPVIYTCRKDVFDDPAQRPHFDTNHHLTVVWDPANLNDAADRLATTIRVTLPGEAKLSDE